jgi:trehalose-6-phosphate synthase
VERLVWEINDRYGTPEWQPVHLIKQSLPADRLAVLYRAADICVVSSLRDGMNLVAKEFVAAQVDGRGALLLSKFAGAAAELEHAIQVNPYDPEDFSRLLRHALTLRPEEKARRIEAMRGDLRSIYAWMAEIFQEWGSIRGGAELPSELAEELVVDPSPDG